MKRKILIVLTFLMFVFSGALYADRLIFTEFGLSYGSVTDPDYISNSTNGVFDTAVFDAKAGVEILQWFDIYAGGAFQFYMESGNWNNFYTFIPFFLGLQVNIFPEWPVYPSVLAEGGMAFASRHYQTGPMTTDDQPWTAGYYNFGIAANWKIADMAVLCLSIERPAMTNNAGSEIHIFKTGLSWKILY